jgi:hypothetical protein
MAGTFDLEAAEAVAACGDVEGWEVLDVLGRLVDKSMVTTVRGDGELRYRLLETLRQFGADRLGESGDQRQVRNRYAQYWATRAVNTDRSGTVQVLDAVDRDLDHYRAAFAELLTGGDADRCAEAFLGLETSWRLRHFREHLGWCQRLLEHDLSDATRLATLALAAYGAALHSPPDVPRLAEEALSLAADHDLDPPITVYSAQLLVARFNDDAAATEEIWTRAATAARRTGNPYLALSIDVQRAIFSTQLTPELVDHYERLIPRVEGFGAPVLMANACHLYGSMRVASGDIERGVQLTDTAVDYAERAGYMVKSGIQGECAGVYLIAGQTDTAAALLRRNLPLCRDAGQTILIAQGTAVVAWIAADDGDLVSAAALTRAARHHLEALGVKGTGPSTMCLEKAEAIVADALHDLSDALSRGEPMNVEETVDELIGVLDRHRAAAANR